MVKELRRQVRCEWRLLPLSGGVLARDFIIKAPCLPPCSYVTVASACRLGVSCKAGPPHQHKWVQGNSHCKVTVRRTV